MPPLGYVYMGTGSDLVIIAEDGTKSTIPGQFAIYYAPPPPPVLDVSYRQPDQEKTDAIEDACKEEEDFGPTIKEANENSTWRRPYLERSLRRNEIRLTNRLRAELVRRIDKLRPKARSSLRPP